MRMKRDLQGRIAALEQKLAASPPSGCARLVRKLVKYKREFARLPPRRGVKTADRVPKNRG